MTPVQQLAASVALSDAIQNANKWVDVARPIIQAWIVMDDAFTSLFKARQADPTDYKRYTEQSPAVRDWAEAGKIIDKARDELYDMLAGIRDNFRCDYCAPQPAKVDDDAAWVRYEDFNDELERSMIGVDAAVRMVEDEA